MLGAYILNGSVFDVGVMLVFGVIGYLIKKADIPAVPIILTLILGPLMEQALRQSLDMSGGRFSILFTRPISATLLVIALLFLTLSTLEIVSRVPAVDRRDSEL